MTSKLTRERVVALIAEHSYDSALVDALEHLLAAMDSEPVAYTDERNLGYIDRGRETAYLWGKQNSEAGDVPLYRHAQPVVPDNTQHFDTIALETAKEIMCDVNRRHEFLGGEVQLLSRIQCRIDYACRAAMLQENAKSAGVSNNCRSNESVQEVQEVQVVLAGNSPVIPEGYVMVPKEPTEAMINAWLSEVANWRGHVAGYKAMLAAAPQEVKGE